MKNIRTIFRKHKKNIFIGIGVFFVFVLILGQFQKDEEIATSFAVVETVKRGSVSSGIETTGTIIAADKLNLDVYKQSKRIEVVNVINGSHVEKGDVLFSFDKSSVNVSAQNAQTKVTEAELALRQEQETYADQNTDVKTLEQQIEELEISITQAKQDKIDVYSDFLNADLKAEPLESDLLEKTQPVISGYYNGDTTGQYKIRVYKSKARSGYSFSVVGISNHSGEIYFNAPLNLGSSGLQITFTEDADSWDEWIVAVPNVYSPEYQKNKTEYEQKVLDLDKKIAGYESDLEIKKQNLKNTSYTDSSDYRDLSLAKVKAELAEARVTLSENYEVIQDQDIIAPFSGTIDGLENVVVGATPSGSVEDPISFGTLISDDFLVRFSLGAVDIEKIELNQKVLVTITSFTNTTPLEATITQISSLPENDGVAQYEVQALIIPDEEMSFELREGLLADVEIVEEEVSDVLVVPRSAVTYENGKATVEVLDTLSEEQQTQVERMGIVKIGESGLPTYPVEITIGLEGSYYVEVISGLEEGQKILITQSTEDETIVLEGFSPGQVPDGAQSGPPPGVQQ